MGGFLRFPLEIVVEYSWDGDLPGIAQIMDKIMRFNLVWNGLDQSGYLV